MMTYIANADKETFWAHATWDAYARLPDKKKYLVIVPLAGFADWGLGHPLDIEETISMAVLKQAVEQTKEEIPIKVVPPLRFVLGPYANCAFSIDPETAYQFVEEVVHSIYITGFRKIVFFNSSPWNEEIINKACARDLRIKYGVQPFSINLYGLGLDFHPVRSTSRRKLQTLGTYLLNREPDINGSGDKIIPADALSVGSADGAPALTDCIPLEEARKEGPAILEDAGEHLSRLFVEIHERKPLPNDGKFEQKKGL